MHLGQHVQCLMFCSISNQSVISRQIFIKDYNIKFQRDFTSGKRTDSSSITDGRTDGRSYKMNLIGFFSRFEKHLNSYIVFPTWFLSFTALCSNSFINFLFAVSLFTISFLSSTSFQTQRSGSKCTHAYFNICDVSVFCCFDLL